MVQYAGFQKAIIEMCDLITFNDPCAVTLTMKQRHQGQALDPIECSRNFRHFSNRFNKAIYGNAFARYNKRVRIIPVLEKSSSQRYHYHTVIDRIDRLSRDQFEKVVADCWQNTTWGYREMDFKFDITQGWLFYITKPSQKSSCSDATDWQNFHV